MDAEAASVVHKAGVARDNPVTVDPAKAQRIRPMSATILERDRFSIGCPEQDDTCVEGPAAERFATNFAAGGHRVPRISRMHPNPVTPA
jgi:hypothetical protein